MVQFTIHYRYSQRFPFSAREAYEWSTDYSSEDISLSGRVGTRRIVKLDESTLLLTDTIKEGSRDVTKVRVIRLFPEILTWINTRISDPGRYSQFIYQVVPEGKHASRLDFIGAQIEEGRKPSRARLASLARQIVKAESPIWVNLAEAMKRDLGPGKSRGASRRRAR